MLIKGPLATYSSGTEHKYALRPSNIVIYKNAWLQIGFLIHSCVGTIWCFVLHIFTVLLGTSVSQNAPARRYVTLAINDNIPIRGLSCGGETDIYRITVTTTSDAEHVAIEGASASGLFYGVQSLSMLVNGNRKGSTTSELLGGSIVDCPRYRYIFSIHTDGLVQGCSISIANATETLQSCTKPLKYLLCCCTYVDEAVPMTMGK